MTECNYCKINTKMPSEHFSALLHNHRRGIGLGAILVLLGGGTWFATRDRPLTNQENQEQPLIRKSVVSAGRHYPDLAYHDDEQALDVSDKAISLRPAQSQASIERPSFNYQEAYEVVQKENLILLNHINKIKKTQGTQATSQYKSAVVKIAEQLRLPGYIAEVRISPNKGDIARIREYPYTTEPTARIITSIDELHHAASHYARLLPPMKVPATAFEAYAERAGLDREEIAALEPTKEVSNLDKLVAFAGWYAAEKQRPQAVNGAVAYRNGKEIVALCDTFETAQGLVSKKSKLFKPTWP